MVPGSTSRESPVTPSHPKGGLAWFCLRSQPKHEHIAAAHLRSREAIEVFVPRIRYRRPGRKGPVWVTEALFPNYLFARFEWETALRRVHHARGVTGVVHFGNQWPTIPDEVVADLQRTIGQAEVLVLDRPLEPGEPVQIAGGIFHGLRAVVTQVLPARERVMVLLDFLGRQTTVEVRLDALVRDQDGPSAVL